MGALLPPQVPSSPPVQKRAEVFGGFGFCPCLSSPHFWCLTLYQNTWSPSGQPPPSSAGKLELSTNVNSPPKAGWCHPSWEAVYIYSVHSTGRVFLKQSYLGEKNQEAAGEALGRLQGSPASLLGWAGQGQGGFLSGGPHGQGKTRCSSIQDAFNSCPWENMLQPKGGGLSLVHKRAGFSGEKVAPNLFCRAELPHRVWPADFGAASPQPSQQLGLTSSLYD